MSLYKVYILANRDLTKIPKRTKIGISLNPHQRIKSLELDKIVYRGFEDLYVYGIYEIDNARALEAAAHIYFKQYRCNLKGFEGCTEFFDIHPQLAERFMLKAGAKKIYDPNINGEVDV
ncbi:GIY-YIG nuclease family protein [Salmonella enterica subsp. enterica serovar Typhimurium]|nr:GIY-YIG nuclease family protein [Salmonella enterica subsp. enterica serovar Typhimurium]